MSSTITSRRSPASTLTFASYASFIPIGIVTVLLGPMLPYLSARWSLNYAQAGALFTAQYLASTCATAVSGLVIASRGYRFTIQVGLLLVTAALTCLLQGSAILGVICICAYGAGLGVAVPAGNLLVAEANPERRSSTLNTLNFCWSAGAVACPFLTAVAVKSKHVNSFLASVAVLSLGIAVGIGFMRRDIEERGARSDERSSFIPIIRSHRITFAAIAGLFLLYVGTENAFGGWIASYAKTLTGSNSATALITPSFFYGTLMIGRLCAPLLLRTINDSRLAQAGMFMGCAGTAGLVFSRGLASVLLSACVAGLGFSSVYPITISLLARSFGSSSRLGSFMFVLSNIGGGLIPWIVGVSATHFGTLEAGLLVPMVGCVSMFVLLLRHWPTEGLAQPI